MATLESNRLSRLNEVVITSVTRHWNQQMKSGASRLYSLSLKINLLRNTIEMDTTQYRATINAMRTYTTNKLSFFADAGDFFSFAAAAALSNFVYAMFDLVIFVCHVSFTNKSGSNSMALGVSYTFIIPKNVNKKQLKFKIIKSKTTKYSFGVFGEDLVDKVFSSLLVSHHRRG